MNMDGDNLSISADSHMESHSTRPLPAMSTTLLLKLASRMETKSSMLDVVLVDRPECVFHPSIIWSVH